MPSSLELSYSEILTFLNDRHIDHQLFGDPNVSNSYQLSSLKNVVPNGIYYMLSSHYNAQYSFENSLIITDEFIDSLMNNAQIVVANPQLVFYHLCALKTKSPEASIHPTAILNNVELGKNVSIGAYCVLNNCRIGDNCQLHSHVVVKDNVIIEHDVEIQSHSCIGASGMAWIWDESGNRIIQPQMGGVIIEAHCKLGTDITIVRGSLTENTRIGKGTLMAHGSKVGHGCQVHENVHFANNVSLAGNAVIEENVFLGSACVVSSNITISKGSIVGAGAVVNKNFNKEYITLAGVPAVIIKENNFESKPKGAPQPLKK